MWSGTIVMWHAESWRWPWSSCLRARRGRSPSIHTRTHTHTHITRKASYNQRKPFDSTSMMDNLDINRIAVQPIIPQSACRTFNAHMLQTPVAAYNGAYHSYRLRPFLTAHRKELMFHNRCRKESKASFPSRLAPLPFRGHNFIQSPCSQP